jgi:hypothetical protein
MVRTCGLFAVALLLSCSTERSLTSPETDVSLAAGGVRGKPLGGADVTVVNLGYYRAMDIDDRGRVVVWECCEIRSLLLDPASQQVNDVGTLGGQTMAARVNQGGEVAASSFDAEGTPRPVIWEAGTLHQLPEPLGSTGGEAGDVADPATLGAARWVVGSVAGYGGLPAVWTASGSGAGFSASAPTLLPVPLGGGGMATAVNSSGFVGGWYGVGAGALPAVWSRNSNGVWELTSLALPSGDTFAQVLDVNASGAAVGISGRASGCNRGVVWATPGSTPEVLPDPAGGTCTWASAINDAGQITGNANSNAALWLPRTGGGYSVRALTPPNGARSSEGHGVSEPRLGTTGTVIEVAGQASMRSGSRAILWRITLSP